VRGTAEADDEAVISTPGVRLVSVSLAVSALMLAAGCSSSGTSDGRAPSTTSTAAVRGTRSFHPGRQVAAFPVAGASRTAVVVVPEARDEPAPLVFAFHGHGGSGARFERWAALEQHWPEAMVVYPDGLPGHQGRTDPEGVKPGWQTRLGELGDRDLAFYDTMLATLERDLPVDRERVYVMGVSNGSAFTSLLLHERGDHIAATATLSGQPGRWIPTDPVRSMFMAMGEQDPIVPFATQRLSIPLAEQHLRIDPSTAREDGYLHTATGPGGIELATYIYPGGHRPPAKVIPLIVTFFQRHPLPKGHGG